MASITRADGGRIYYDEAGDGPPLLLFCGMISVRQIWAPDVPELSQHFRLIMIDNRESGESDPETADYTMADMARDGVTLLDALKIDRAHVLGHSMGGFIALHLAVDHPARIDRLVLVSTTAATGVALDRPAPHLESKNWIADPVERSRRQLRSAAAPGYFDAHPDQLEYISALTSGNRLSFEGMQRRMMATYSSHDVRDRLASVTAPTLIIHGDTDRAIPLESGRALAAAMPNAKLTTFEGVGHFPQFERASDFHRAVIEFLNVPAT